MNTICNSKNESNSHSWLHQLLERSRFWLIPNSGGGILALFAQEKHLALVSIAAWPSQLRDRSSYTVFQVRELAKAGHNEWFHT